MKKILILGGGFAGTWAALAAASEVDRLDTAVEVSLLSRDSYLTNRPRLYERTTDELRFPLEETLHQVGVGFIQGEVVSIAPSRKSVRALTEDGVEIELSYDRLVLTTGSVLQELPIPGLATSGFDVDTFAAASRLERHLQSVLTDSKRQGHDCLVVIGGGFTGIELATELRVRIAAIAGRPGADAARIVMVERADTVGAELGDGPRSVIEAALSEAKVEIRTSQQVESITPDVVVLSDGTQLPCCTVVASTGLRASPLAAELSADLDELGRVRTDDYLCVDGIRNVLAAGDVARARVDDERVALMSCQHAMPMGRYAGCNAARDLAGLPLYRFRHPSYVTCLDLGVAGAVFTTGWDRQVVMHGTKAKELKQEIVRESIAPPTGSRAEILSAASVSPEE